MLKKRCFPFLILLLCFVLIAVLIQTAHRVPQGEMLGRIENALGGSWSKGAVTEVTPFVYADQEGNIIVY